MILIDIEKKIGDACRQVGRELSSVTLIAVSKLQPPEKIVELLEQGHRVFAENRVQEAEEKWSSLREQFPDVELHLIGHLQTNKVKEAVRLFDVIETVDSKKLAEALADEMKKQGRNIPCFIQVNTGEEEQKTGVAPKDIEKLYRFCIDKAGLNIMGLMCLPPADDIPELHFALLHKYATALGIPCLSMGMSADYEAAIRLGSTHVRIGSALFGERGGR